MATWLVMLLFSVGAVLLFVVGMSLTLMIKGHHIDGEISTNRHMRARGITCAVKDAAASGSGSRTGAGARSGATGSVTRVGSGSAAECADLCATVNPGHDCSSCA